MINARYFTEKLRRSDPPAAQIISDDVSRDELVQEINRLRLQVTYLQNRSVAPKNANGSVRSEQSSSTASNSSLLDDKFELTDYVTDVSGKIYQVVKTSRGKLRTLRANAHTVALSASQQERSMRLSA